MERISWDFQRIHDLRLYDYLDYEDCEEHETMAKELRHRLVNGKHAGKFDDILMDFFCHGYTTGTLSGLKLSIVAPLLRTLYLELADFHHQQMQIWTQVLETSPFLTNVRFDFASKVNVTTLLKSMARNPRSPVRQLWIRNARCDEESEKADLIHAWKQITKLEELDLHNCCSEFLEAFFQGLTCSSKKVAKLKSLRIAHDTTTNCWSPKAVSNFFKSHQHLTRLVIVGTGTEFCLPHLVGTIPNVTDLTIDVSVADDTTVSVLREIKNLCKLFTAVVNPTNPDFLRVLSRMKSLEALTLGSLANETVPVLIKKCPRLEFINCPIAFLDDEIVTGHDSLRRIVLGSVIHIGFGSAAARFLVERDALPPKEDVCRVFRSLRQKASITDLSLVGYLGPSDVGYEPEVKIEMEKMLAANFLERIELPLGPGFFVYTMAEALQRENCSIQDLDLCFEEDFELSTLVAALRNNRSVSRLSIRKQGQVSPKNFSDVVDLIRTNAVIQRLEFEAESFLDDVEPFALADLASAMAENTVLTKVDFDSYELLPADTISAVYCSRNRVHAVTRDDQLSKSTVEALYPRMLFQISPNLSAIYHILKVSPWGRGDWTFGHESGLRRSKRKRSPRD